MKKLMMFLGLISLLALTACGGGDTAAPGGTPAGGAAEDAVQADSGESPAGAETEESAAYVFSYNGTDIPIDAEAAPILAALGEPDSYYEAASCAFNGLDKYYTYASFEVDTYPDETGVDRISYVILRDDLVSTAEGVSIGDSAEQAERVYGPGETDGASATWERGGMRLEFLFENDAVTSIQYQTKVLDGTAAD